MDDDQETLHVMSSCTSELRNLVGNERRALVRKGAPRSLDVTPAQTLANAHHTHSRAVWL